MMMNKFALISILSLFTTTFEAVNGQGKYFSYCTTDFTRGCDVYDPDTVSLKGSPTEIEIRCYNSRENFCLEVKEVVQPFPFAETCTEESGCLCPDGNCEMPNCKSDCDCAGGFCDMPKCTGNCDCDGGFCSMPTCGAECFCADGGCDIPSCCGGACECGSIGCNLRNSVNTVDLPGVKSCSPGVGADYRKAKKYFRKFANVKTPDKEHYLFYSYDSNCTEILNTGFSSITECNMHGWNGTLIGTDHYKCDFMGGDYDPTVNATLQNPLVTCDRFRKFESGNYFHEKTLFNLADPIVRSIINGGTGVFVGASGDSIAMPLQSNAIYLETGERPPAPQVWFVKALNAKDVAHEFWAGFDPEKFGLVPPDFTALPDGL